MLALWLESLGQTLLIWGAVGAVSLAGATFILNLLQMGARYAWQWHQMRDLPTLPGCYPLVGHTLMMKPGGKAILVSTHWVSSLLAGKAEEQKFPRTRTSTRNQSSHPPPVPCPGKIGD